MEKPKGAIEKAFSMPDFTK